LPATPLPPVFSLDVPRSGEQSHFDLWRQSCPGGGSIVLLRVTPITPGAFICDLSFALVQGASQFDILLTDQNETFGFCNNLFVPSTFYVAPDGPAYDPQQPFTLLFDTVTGSPRFATLEVAAGPLPPSPPTITVVATACTTCHSGQVVGYIMNINNPGPTMVAEIKAGARFPNGSILALVNTLATLPTGPTILTLVPPQALPGGLPPVDLAGRSRGPRALARVDAEPAQRDAAPAALERAFAAWSYGVARASRPATAARSVARSTGLGSVKSGRAPLAGTSSDSPQPVTRPTRSRGQRALMARVSSRPVIPGMP
jgi:hypothetical protein